MQKYTGILFIILFFPLLVSAGPFDATLSGDIPAILAPQKGQDIHLNVKIHEGAFRMKLRYRPHRSGRIFINGNESPEDSPQVLLFQGRFRNKRNIPLRRVSAALYLDKTSPELEIKFFGKRKRPYTIEAFLPAESSSSVTARVTHVSSHYGLGCAAQTKIFPESTPAILEAPDPDVAILQPDRYLDVATDADAEFAKEHGKRTNARILAIFNTVEAIFSSQIGIRFNVVFQNTFSELKKQPYKSKDSQILLQQFQVYTNANRHLGAADLYHVFTGKQLEESVVGLAFVGTTCQFQGLASYGLTRKTNDNIQALVTAHELGHNFGARHSSGKNSLMNPIITPEKNQFNNISLGEIISYVDTHGSCLSTTPGALISLKVKRKKRKKKIRFNGILEGQGNGKPCSLHLFGASKKKHLNGIIPPFTTKAQELYAGPNIGTPLTFSFNSPAEKQNTRVSNVYLRAGIFCDGQWSLSKIKRVRGAKRSSKQLLKRYQNQIISSLQ